MMGRCCKPRAQGKKPLEEGKKRIMVLRGILRASWDQKGVEDSGK